MKNLAKHPVLLFIPLDDRPVCLDFVVDLANAAGVEVRVPDRGLLGSRNQPGDANGLRLWLKQQAVGADAIIASIEMLCLGGLVASRKSEISFEEVQPYLEQLTEVAAKTPTYVSAVIPRTPLRPTEEDAPYWAVYGQTLLKLPPGRLLTVDQPIETVLRAVNLPEPVLTAVRRHRGRHLRLNAHLIDAAVRGTFRYVLVGQDDTSPGGLSQLERAALQTHLATLNTDKALITSGADELGARLLARWLNDLTEATPAVEVMYTYPDEISRIPLYEATSLEVTVIEHIQSSGCVEAEGLPDILFWVHNFEGRQREAVDQQDDLDEEAINTKLAAVGRATGEEEVVALADVRFANGGDRALMSRLLAEPRMAGIVAYSGWNTCSNSLGAALAQAVVASHLRADNLPGSDRLYRPALFMRILEDWGYQAVVRPKLSEWVKEQGSTTPSDISVREAEVEARAAEALKSEALPLIGKAFPYQPVTLSRLSFPWHRLFDARIELDVKRAGRPGPGGIRIAEYDPQWPAAFEEARTDIQRTLGPMAIGIEHVGSTAVPGLASKPIIDIMVGVSEEDLDRVIEPLVAAGYEYNPDWEISMPLRRYFVRVTPDGANTHHVHVVAWGKGFWTRHKRFRDYLRSHPDKAQEYAALKKALAAQYKGSIDYTFAKRDFIRSIEALAGVAPRAGARAS